MCYGPFLLMDPVNPVLPGEGRWLPGDAPARASEETGVQSDLTRTLQTTFQLSQRFFFGLEDCMFSLWSLCSRSLMYSSSAEESVRLKEDHMKDINSTVVRLPIFVLDSKIVAETDVVAESVEDMFPSFKCMVPCNGLWRDGNLETHTQRQGMAFKKYICEIKRARGESMTSWINRSDEALMDTWGEFLRINDDPFTNSRLVASPQGEIERSGHCWSHDHDRRQLEHQTCCKVSS